MSNPIWKKIFHKSRIYPVVLILLVLLVWRIRENKKEFKEFHIQGETMGSIEYNVKYLRKEEIPNLKERTDSLLKAFNQSLSTYIKDSEISRFNQGLEHQYESPFFYPVLLNSSQMFERTEGAFDPTIMPLVNAWGFGPDDSRNPDSVTVDSLKKLVDFRKIQYDEERVKKTQPGMMLDFSANAKGYAVDVIAVFLESMEVENYLVEIGGDLKAKGFNRKYEHWKIYIESPDPKDPKQSGAVIVEIVDRALATSGNYRNFYEVDGQKVSHTLDPVSGYPAYHNLLSASIFAPDCMTADALATAVMVMGLEKAKELIKKEEGFDAYLIYSDENGQIKSYASPGIREYIRSQNY